MTNQSTIRSGIFSFRSLRERMKNICLSIGVNRIQIHVHIPNTTNCVISEWEQKHKNSRKRLAFCGNTTNRNVNKSSLFLSTMHSDDRRRYRIDTYANSDSDASLLRALMVDACASLHHRRQQQRTNIEYGKRRKVHLNRREQGHFESVFVFTLMRPTTHRRTTDKKATGKRKKDFEVFERFKITFFLPPPLRIWFMVYQRMTTQYAAAEGRERQTRNWICVSRTRRRFQAIYLL